MQRKWDKKRIGTLADIKAAKLQLRLWCERRECWRGVDMDLDALIARFGETMPLQAVLERARCEKCGARWPEVGCQTVPADVPLTRLG